MITPVILAGGTGARLWPLSRAMYPKQFLQLHSDESMLQEALRRLDGIDVGQPLIVSNEEHRFLVAEHVRQLGVNAKILLEPVGRNTAPAIALAALELADSGFPDGLMLVLPADHVVEDSSALRAAILNAAEVAEAGAMVTFGIVPTFAATGYGYIRSDTVSREGKALFPVLGFVEKPDHETARQYVEAEDYYWNSGMFLFRADRFLRELGKYRPDILDACKKASVETASDMDFVRVDSEAFARCPSDSIDYAVMEPLCNAEGDSQVFVAPLDAGWSDVGSWDSLWDIKSKDANNNVVEGDVILEQAKNSFIYGQERLVAAVGVSNLVIVDTKDSLLVAEKGALQDVKSVVRAIESQQRVEYLQHREVFRPWGKYDSIDEGDGYQVKHITVSPGEKLSLQMHNHRAEHWVVVKGTAQVRCGDKTFLLKENQSTYIPQGEVHQLSNPSDVALEIIEIQSGSYLGEDDIVRFEDCYGRN